jgi:hypothetical protein
MGKGKLNGVKQIQGILPVRHHMRRFSVHHNRHKFYLPNGGSADNAKDFRQDSGPVNRAIHILSVTEPIAITFYEWYY